MRRRALRSRDLPQTKERLDAAVDIAAGVFLRKGYERASIEDLVQATGLNRYAIYQAFGGKRELLIAALGKYHNEKMADLAQRMADGGGDTLVKLRAYFDEPLRDLSADCGAETPASLLCQIFFEVAPHDAVIYDALQHFFSDYAATYVAAFAEAQREGNLAPGLTAEQAASITMTAMFGLAAQAYGGAPHSVLAEAMDAIFAALSAHPSAIDQT